MASARKKRKTTKKPPAIIQHLKEIGFTNRLAIYLVALLFLGLAGGFVLAVLSIKYQYTGALACYTVVFTPIGTALSIVLARVVEKSRDENTGPNGEGIKYATAMAELEAQTAQADDADQNSPAI